MLIQVSDLKFAQPARRNLLAPVLLAFLILGIVLALLLRFTPHKTADISIIRTTIYPTHTVFKSDTIAGGEEVTTSAVEKLDLDNVYTSFPALKPLASEPLLRETMISPGQSAEGMILLHFPVTKEVWDHRRKAVLNVDLYHQGEQEVLISRASEAVSNATHNPATSPVSSPTH
jgi:hypothetical protein